MLAVPLVLGGAYISKPGTFNGTMVQNGSPITVIRTTRINGTVATPLEIKRFARGARTSPGLLAIDVGGTRIKAARSSGSQLSAPVIQRTERTPHGLVAQLAQLHAAHGAPDQWALCLPGPVRDGTWWAHEPFPKGPVPIADMLSARELPVPFCCRDSEAALAGEADGRSIALIQVGTGIGCGVTVDGKMLRDRRGEPVGLWMAHLPLLADGAPCARCGGRGCVSTHASARGIMDQLGKEVSADELRALAIAGEQPYAQVYDRALDALAKLAQMAAMNFRPQDVRLAGGSAGAWRKDLMPRVRAGLSRLPQPAIGSTRATLSSRGELAALEGLVVLHTRAGPFSDVRARRVAMHRLPTGIGVPAPAV